MGSAGSVIEQCIMPAAEVEIIYPDDYDDVTDSEELDIDDDTESDSDQTGAEYDVENNEIQENKEENTLVAHENEKQVAPTEEVPKSVMKSFQELVAFFETTAENVTHRETHLIKAFLLWLGGLNINDGKETKKAKKSNARVDDKSPDELIQLLKNDPHTYTTMFKLFCWAAGIKCERIEGVCRTDNLEETIPTEWVAVQIQDGWKIVYPLRICLALSDQLRIEMVPGNKSISETDVQTAKASFLAYYIFPDPEQFIYECLPNDSSWQTIDDAISYDEFLTLERYHFPWWTSGLRLTSRRQHKLSTNDGSVTISLSGDEKVIKRTLLYAKVQLIEAVNQTENTAVVYNSEFLQRLVMLNRQTSSFVCKFVSPTEGIYKLTFYSGEVNKPLYAICSFIIACRERCRDIFPLAKDPGFLGLGPGPLLKSAGLLSSNYLGGIIKFEMQKIIKLKFGLASKQKQKRSFKAVLLNEKNEIADKFTHCSETTAMFEKHLEITVLRPDETGQYLLEILQSVDGVKWQPVCYFLVVYKSIPKIFIERCSQKVARKKISKVIEVGTKNQIMLQIQDSLAKGMVETDCDIQRARGRVAVLKLNKKKTTKYTADLNEKGLNSNNILSQSLYEKRMTEMINSGRKLNNYLRKMYCSSSKQRLVFDQRRLANEDRNVLYLFMTFFGKPLYEKQAKEPLQRLLKTLYVPWVAQPMTHHRQCKLLQSIINRWSSTDLAPCGGTGWNSGRQQSYMKHLKSIITELEKKGLVLEDGNIKDTAKLLLQFKMNDMKLACGIVFRAFKSIKEVVQWMTRATF